MALLSELRGMTLMTFFMRSSFGFIDPGPMIDGDLELVEPAERWIDEVVISCRHPLTQRDMPQQGRTTRDGLLSYLRHHPRGRTKEDISRGAPPAYAFWLRLIPECFPRGDRPSPMAGAIGLRIGGGENIELYLGHMGYHVYPQARGRHLAERACRLLMPLARSHGLRMMWITCNPDNLASRRTCERLGGKLIDVVAVPKENALYGQGDREKCRYRIEM